MAFVGLIPARGGSRRIPGKNLANCAGKPLIVHTITAAASCNCLDRTILSTDDHEIADVATRYGADVPFLRPAEIADGDTPMIAVMRHALQWLRDSGCVVDALVLLQPTSPLRTARHIDEAIHLFRQHPEAESVCSVVVPPHIFHPLKVLKPGATGMVPYIDGHIRIAGQRDLPTAYALNGPAVLVVKPDVIERGEVYGGPCIPYVMPLDASIDVDEPYDLKIVNALMTQIEDPAY